MSDVEREGESRKRRASSVGRRNQDLPEDEQTLFSDTEEDLDMSGAAKAEAAQAVW